MRPGAATPFTLVQANLCLSGLAGCYAKVRYPAGVRDVVAQIRAVHPDAVTLNEACSGDVAAIAAQVGYQARFSTVNYYGRPLTCVDPTGRGRFGDAVLTRAAVHQTSGAPFRIQAGPEQRRWLCVTTHADVAVCTAHLASRDVQEATANAPQCAELRGLLERLSARRTAVIFGGDVNRRATCAPRRWWAVTDAAASQDPGSQQGYGAGSLRSASASVRPAPHTDHDVLLVRALT